jgi:hypothetical protein
MPDQLVPKQEMNVAIILYRGMEQTEWVLHAVQTGRRVTKMAAFF